MLLWLKITRPIVSKQYSKFAVTIAFRKSLQPAPTIKKHVIEYRQKTSAKILRYNITLRGIPTNGSNNVIITNRLTKVKNAPMPSIKKIEVGFCLILERMVAN